MLGFFFFAFRDSPVIQKRCGHNKKKSWILVHNKLGTFLNNLLWVFFFFPAAIYTSFVVGGIMYRDKVETVWSRIVMWCELCVCFVCTPTQPHQIILMSMPTEKAKKMKARIPLRNLVPNDIGSLAKHSGDV